jgi:hypothetical protein
MVGLTAVRLESSFWYQSVPASIHSGRTIGVALIIEQRIIEQREIFKQIYP